MLVKLFTPENRKKFGVAILLTLPVVSSFSEPSSVIRWIYLGILLLVSAAFAIFQVVQSHGALTSKDKVGILIFAVALGIAVYYFSY